MIYDDGWHWNLTEIKSIYNGQGQQKTGISTMLTEKDVYELASYNNIQASKRD